MEWIKRVSLLVAVVTLSGCSVTSVRMHEDFAQHAKEIERVAIVPPVVKMEQLTFDGEPVRLEQQELAMQTKLVNEASARLRDRGFEPVVVDRAEMLQQFASFNVDLATLRDTYKSISETLYNGKQVQANDIATFRQSVGDAAITVAHYTNSDAILLMQYSGWEKSKGSVAKDVASSILLGVLTAGAVVPVQATSGEAVEAALIDGDSGDVIWTNVLHGVDNSGAAVGNNFDALEQLEGQPKSQVADNSDSKKL